MMPPDLPTAVEAVFRQFHTCELATIARDGTPIVWPATPLYLPEAGQFMLTTSIGLPQKAFNIRRNPRVSMLFSNPTGSGLDSPPAVLVRGDATISDELVTWNENLAAFWPHLFRVQPFGKRYSANAVTRKLMDWYYMRLVIHVTPCSIQWWPDGDMRRQAETLEVSYVG